MHPEFDTEEGHVLPSWESPIFPFQAGLDSDMSLPCSSPMLVPLPRAALEHQQALAEPSLYPGGLDRHCHPPEAFSLLQTPCFSHGSLQPLSCHHHQGSTTITNMSLPMDGHRALDSRDGCWANSLMPVSASPRALTANPPSASPVPARGAMAESPGTAVVEPEKGPLLDPEPVWPPAPSPGSVWSSAMCRAW